MPISGGSSGNLSEELIQSFVQILGEFKSLGGAGTPLYRYAKAASIPLLPNQPTLLLGGTEDKSLREITLRNSSTVPIKLHWVSDGISYPFAILEPGHFLQDVSDGGIRLEASASQPANIHVSVRSEVEIFYQIGKEIMPYFPVEVGLHIGTGANFNYVSQPIQDAASSSFDLNINKFFNSDENVTGWKLASMKMFTPGEDIEFDIQVEGTSYSDALKIQFQWINLLTVGRLLLAVGSDVINPESQPLDPSVAGISTQLGYAGEVSATGGLLTVRPNFLNLIGRFAAVSTNTGKYDTAIIKSYTPNEDKLKGGTFLLEGF